MTETVRLDATRGKRMREPTTEQTDRFQALIYAIQKVCIDHDFAMLHFDVSEAHTPTLSIIIEGEF